MALINPQTGSSSIYDPTLPARIVAGQAQAPTQSPDTIASTSPGQGPQYNPSFGADTSPTPAAPAPVAPAGPLTYAPSFNLPTDFAPSPLGSALGATVKGNYLNRYLGNVDASGAPYPMRPATRPATGNLNRYLGNVDARGAPYPAGSAIPSPNTVQTAQAPAPATPQGWNLFAAIGQALGHLLGYNAQGQPQGMTGLIRNPVQTAPTQTAALRMPGANRYQGRTLVG